MPLRIANTATHALPIDFAGVTPEANRGRSLREIRQLKLRRGNREVELGELFDVDGDSTDDHWRLEGDFSAVHSVGQAMAGGSIAVDGPIGRHAGARMSGGRLEIAGDAGDYLGAEMRGGTIRVRGNAGDHAGGAYPGSRRGMTGGEILIDGDVGAELGARMRRGLIAVAGAAGDFIGMRMLAGSIFVFGSCGASAGLLMRRGTIGLFGQEPPQLLPTFRAGYEGPLSVLHLVEKSLHARAFHPARLRNLAGVIRLFHGDLVELGRGEILVPALHM